ncbi:MAG: galactokinase [Chitinophagaceae bacterium]|jgi:galactokinase|nr:galactokinase [Chitinophagaceae bacterium]
MEHYTFDLARFKSFVQPGMTVAKSPGRINLIGEHTDYNNGFVLPAAIDKAAWIAAGKREDNRIVLYSVAFDQHFETTLDDIKPAALSWPNYLLGVADQLLKAGLPLTGFSAVVDGDVPIGAGLSSSAAVECATIFALNALYGWSLSRKEMALMTQRAEHEFAGVKCGIMDMYASLFGKKDHVIRLDCRSLEHEYYPLNTGAYTLLLLDTKVKHSLASSAYNERRQQCEAGVHMVQQRYPDVASLRDVTLAMLDDCVPHDDIVYQRCRYVIEENMRLLAGCEDLNSGNLQAFGQKMFATHEGLSKAYAVSCAELDLLVEQARLHPQVIGSRMMGGGFGGCTINLVHQDGVDAFIKDASAAYFKAFGVQPEPIMVRIEDGTGLA